VFGVIDHDWQGVAIGVFVLVFVGRKLVVDRRVRRASSPVGTPPDRLLLAISIASLIAAFCFSAFITIEGIVHGRWDEAALGAVPTVMLAALVRPGTRTRRPLRSKRL
jgi:peptidoglycan/LPS O-acetylase OafA/YrhL